MGGQRFFLRSGADSLCSAVNNNSNVNSYTQKPTPTPTYQPSSTKYSYAAKALLGTVDLDLSNIHKRTIMDSGATVIFWSQRHPQ